MSPSNQPPQKPGNELPKLLDKFLEATSHIRSLLKDKATSSAIEDYLSSIETELKAAIDDFEKTNPTELPSAKLKDVDVVPMGLQLRLLATDIWKKIKL
ncbi:hypothetical protein NDI49_15160 [Trichocoleus sp. ST-U3]|uniref:hypothetical protein n=1 Tax=Coleofasciculus sp. FACHB-542 TaxID=2692787 RepID=UPI001688E7E6|nr:hypothetical protein [Coleofasciculus sp. FACHB-542]MBD2084587.1 hypothetical protein [Coleofasciculus sp. FACHB-542]